MLRCSQMLRWKQLVENLEQLTHKLRVEVQERYASPLYTVQKKLDAVQAQLSQAQTKNHDLRAHLIQSQIKNNQLRAHLNASNSNISFYKDMWHEECGGCTILDNQLKKAEAENKILKHKLSEAQAKNEDFRTKVHSLLELIAEIMMSESSYRSPSIPERGQGKAEGCFAINWGSHNDWSASPWWNAFRAGSCWFKLCVCFWSGCEDERFSTQVIACQPGERQEFYPGINSKTRGDWWQLWDLEWHSRHCLLLS